MLDGTRDRTALLDRLTEITLAEELRVDREGQQLTDPTDVRQALGEALEKTLADYAKLGLLKS